MGQAHHGEGTEPPYHMPRLSPGLMIEAIQDLSSQPSQRAMSFRKCAGLVSRTIFFFFRELFLNLFRGVGETHSEELFHKHVVIISADFLLRFPSNEYSSPVEMGVCALLHVTGRCGRPCLFCGGGNSRNFREDLLRGVCYFKQFGAIQRIRQIS